MSWLLRSAICCSDISSPRAAVRPFSALKMRDFERGGLRALLKIRKPFPAARRKRARSLEIGVQLIGQIGTCVTARDGRRKQGVARAKATATTELPRNTLTASDCCMIAAAFCRRPFAAPVLP